MLLKPVEPRLPLPLLVGDPAAQPLHALDVQSARSPLTVDALVDQPAAPQDADVAGDGLVRQIERLGELTDSGVASSQPRHDRPTGAVAEGGEDGIQVGVDVGNSCHSVDGIRNELLVQGIRCARDSLNMLTTLAPLG